MRHSGSRALSRLPTAPQDVLEALEGPALSSEASVSTSEPTADTPASAPVGAGFEVAPYRWVIIGQLWFHQMMNQTAQIGLGVLLIGIGAELQFGPREAGWLGATRNLGQLLVFPASFLAVRFAPKGLYGALMAVVGLAMLLAGFAPTFAALFLCQSLFSLAGALAQVPGSLLRIQWVPSKELGRVWGTGNALNALAQTGALVGIPLLLGPLGGWRGVMQASGIVLLLSALLWLVFGRQRGEFHVPDRASNYGALRRPTFYLMGLATLGGATAYLSALLFLPTFFVQERGLSLQTAGLISGVFPAAGLVSNILAGMLSDRIGRRKPFIWPVGLILPPLYVLAVSPIPVWALVIVASLLGFFAWLPFPALNSIAYEIPGVQPAEVAVGQALMQAVSGAGVLMGPIIVGTIAAATGSLQIAIMSIGVLPLLLTLSCLWLPDTGPKANLEAS